MKSISLYAKNVTHGLHLIEKYKIDSNPFLHQNKSGKWNIIWESRDASERFQIHLPLTSRIIKSFITKYGKKMEDSLIACAIKFKDKHFLRVIWKHIDGKNQTVIMAELLGTK